MMDLPKALQDLLATLLANNALKSWQIFDEKNMDIVVKMRFAGGHCGQAEVTTARYRRKAPAQVRRDQARSATYKQQHAQRTAEPSTVTDKPCLSTKAHVPLGPEVIVEKKKITKKATKSTAKPRSSRTARLRMTENNEDRDGDIEQIRTCVLSPEPSLDVHDVSTMSLGPYTPTPGSFIHVSDNSACSLSPDAAPFVSHMCSSLLEEEEPYTVDPCDPPYETMSEDSETTTESDCNTIESICVTNHRCPCLHGCEFGPGDNANEHDEHKHYQCGRCSTGSPYMYVICEPCVSMGMDKEHLEYMTDCVVK